MDTASHCSALEQTAALRLHACNFEKKQQNSLKRGIAKVTAQLYRGVYEWFIAKFQNVWRRSKLHNSLVFKLQAAVRYKLYA